MAETKTRYLVTSGVMNTLYTRISLEDSGKQRYLKLHFMQTYTTPSPYPHDDVIKLKHFPRNCHLCGEFTGPRWSPRTKGSDAEFDVSLICVWINDWVNNREAGDLRRYRAHYDVIVM